MDIQIKNGEARGILLIEDPLELLRDSTVFPDDLLCRLVNFTYWMTYDWFSRTYTIEMRGSIVSMMQFRKLILVNVPKILE